jgi:hypothetical protein
MQGMAQAAGLRRPTETTPLEVPSSGLRLARGRTPPRAGSAPFEERILPRVVPHPLEGSLPLERVAYRSRVRPALGLTQAFNAATPRDGAIMHPGLAPRCRRTNSPGRRPSPPQWEGTVRYGRCQSRDTVRPLQYG